MSESVTQGTFFSLLIYFAKCLNNRQQQQQQENFWLTQDSEMIY